MRCIPLTDLSEVVGLSVGADIVPGLEACIDHSTFENLNLFGFKMNMTLC